MGKERVGPVARVAWDEINNTPPFKPRAGVSTVSARISSYIVSQTYINEIQNIPTFSGISDAIFFSLNIFLEKRE